MKLNLRNPMQWLLALFFALSLTACQGLQPQNMTEGMLAAETAATTARQVGEQATIAGKLTKSQAQFVQRQADLVVEGVKAARDLRFTNPAAAQNQYQMTADILKALQQFLIAQGATK